MDAIVIDKSQLMSTLIVIKTKTDAGIVISGYPGCGKTKAMRELLANEPKLVVRWSDFLEGNREKMLQKMRDYATTGATGKKWLVMDAIGKCLDDDVGNLLSWLQHRGFSRHVVLTDQPISTIPTSCLEASMSVVVKMQVKEFPDEVLSLFSDDRTLVMESIARLVTMGNTIGGILEYVAQYAVISRPAILPIVTDAQIRCKTSPWDTNDIALFFFSIPK